MKTVVFCHSTTGNTRLAAERITRGLEAGGGQAHLLDVVDVLRDHQLSEAAACVAACDLVGFGSPVQAWKPTATIVDFARALPLQEGKPAFVFCTHGGQPANSLLLLSRTLQERGFRPVAGHALIAEDNWPILRAVSSRPPTARHPSRGELARLDAFARALPGLVEAGAPPADFPFIRSWMHVLGQVITPAYLRRGTGRKKADPARCTRCGLCARGCPAQAIRMAPYPEFSGSCVGCWACYNNCPEKAIDSFVLFGRDGRYRGPRRAAWVL